MRQIVLDTETTGLLTTEGHRIIEIGAIELISRQFTGRTFHQYIQPQRAIDEGALAVHGITAEFLANKPLFTAIVDQFLEFIIGAELIIHNAPFDIGFINYEFQLAGVNYKRVDDHCTVFDTLQFARKKHPGQQNSLDALCKRYSIDNSHREYHGALLDASLLAQVYLAMTGGQTSLFVDMQPTVIATTQQVMTSDFKRQQQNLPIIHASEEEQQAHQKILELIKKNSGLCLWPQDV